jgi:hypothetical protein
VSEEAALPRRANFHDEIRPGTERGERSPGNRHQYRQHAATLAQFGRGVTVESDRPFG